VAWSGATRRAASVGHRRACDDCTLPKGKSKRTASKSVVFWNLRLEREGPVVVARAITAVAGDESLGRPPGEKGLKKQKKEGARSPL
jgi:hypothetical protein